MASAARKLSDPVAPVDVDLSGVARAVGSGAYSRGRTYARRGRVLRRAWDDDAGALVGSVIGNGALYETVVLLTANPEGDWTFDAGECSCPIGEDCKHVAALAIAEWGDHAAPKAAPRRLAAVPQARPWERALRGLLDAPGTHPAGQPLAIELAVTPANGTGRLTARLLRPGARGGWVSGSLSWNALEYWSSGAGDCRPDHVELVRELRAVHRTSERSSYSYYGAEKWLDLTNCSARIWALLDEAVRLGIHLVDARKGVGELEAPGRGEVVLDVSRRDDFHAARAVLRLEGGGTLEPALFLGSTGHGLAGFDAEGADPSIRLLRLVRLEPPAPKPLQRLLLEGGSLEIPPGELAVFAEELCPALRHVATVVSSDGSFVPPEISAPELVLSAHYGENHSVALAWEWAYRIGESVRRAPFEAGEASPGFRDLAAERALLATTDLSGSGLERYGLLDNAGRPLAVDFAWLEGLDCLRFTTEELPGLAELPGLLAEVDGELPDFRDIGASLEIGVSTAEIAGERDWFDLGVSLTVGGRELPLGQVLVALASGDPHMLLDDGSHFSLLDPRLQSLRQLLEEARALTDAPAGPLRISRYQAGLWSELVALGVVSGQARAWQAQVDGLLEVESLAAHEPPATLDAELRPYQRDGFGWLASHWELRLGGILADDMGLGKTVETLALICHARLADPGLAPFLVVAPTSVVSNWVAEAARFAPGLRVTAATDTLAKSGRGIEEIAAADVVVTTYTLLRLDAEAYGSVAWAGVVLDEAQYVKNHQAKTYRCVRRLEAPFKLALTGTPMENSLLELWSLLSITAPGLFPDPKRFTEQYARPIEREGDTESLARLRRRIKPLVLRRTKEVVASDLPAKQEQAVEVDLHPRHRRLYDTYLQRERQKVLGLLGDFDRNRFTILRSITLLRQLSLHAGLVDEASGAVPCAKIDVLLDELADVAGGGHRALVFSQFTGFLARVRERLDAEGIGYCYLDGKTRRRDRVLDAFRGGDDPVFLISLKAGGFGLNLTEADYCFLLDPWWNPATEAQAIDRTHRIGQTRPVMVYRLIARDTIEEKVVALARRKAALFTGVMDDGDLFSGALTAEDVRGLLD